MFRPFKRTLSPADLPDLISTENFDIEHFASGVTGGSLALSNTATTDGLAHHIAIRNNLAVDASAITATFIGTDADNQSISETINLPTANGLVLTTLFFKTTQSPVALSADLTFVTTLDIGINAEFVSKTYPSGTYYGNLNIGTEFDSTTTINYGIDHTFSDIQKEPSTEWHWLNNANDMITNSSTTDFKTIRPVALRFRTNSYETGAVVEINLGQSYN